MAMKKYPDGSFEFGDAKEIHPNCNECGGEIRAGERAVHVEKQIRSPSFSGRAVTTSHAGCGEGKYRYDENRRIWVA